MLRMFVSPTTRFSETREFDTVRSLLNKLKSKVDSLAGELKAGNAPYFTQEKFDILNELKKQSLIHVENFNNQHIGAFALTNKLLGLVDETVKKNFAALCVSRDDTRAYYESIVTYTTIGTAVTLGMGPSFPLFLAYVAGGAVAGAAINHVTGLDDIMPKSGRLVVKLQEELHTLSAKISLESSLENIRPRLAFASAE